MSIFKGTTEPKKIYYWTSIIISDTQGPCSVGFHVPSSSDFQIMVNIGIALNLWDMNIGSSPSNISSYLKLPFAGRLAPSDGNHYVSGSQGAYWTSESYSTSDASNFVFSNQIYFPNNFPKGYGNSIRPFKDYASIPDSSWTVIYQGPGSAGIYHNSTLGLISMSSDGINWITIADKNLGATQVYNSGDTLSENNCGKLYQWGNNYGFSWTGATKTSSTKVDASTYGPGNYYNSDTFILTGYGENWDTTANDNLRGGDTGVSTKREIKAVYLGENKVRPSGPDKDYLCFTAGQANSTVQLDKNGTPAAVTLETSTDGRNWSTYTFGTTITLPNIGDKVYWRNTSETTTGFSTAPANRYQFAMSGSISASGDITYLINKNGADTVSNLCFYRLFGDCSALTTPPTFNATTLSTNCYQQMFLRCTGLDTLPILPATSLPDYCYAQMFQQCSKIKISTSKTGIYQTPYRIPNTGTGTAASNTFYYMFSSTGGSFTGNPSVNTTYYTSNTVV